MKMYLRAISLHFLHPDLNSAGGVQILLYSELSNLDQINVDPLQTV